MKSVFPKLVERGRVVGGPYSSPPKATFGAFFFKDRLGRRFRVIACDGDETGWDHISVSLPNRKRPPTWAEMCWVKDLFFDQSEAVYQIHPRKEDYVNDHPYCLHLWRPTKETMLLPDPILVGTGRKGAQ